MMDEFERRLRQEIAESERGTWREEMRSDFAPWFDSLLWGFQCADGWAEYDLRHQMPGCQTYRRGGALRVVSH
ncbi:hypothetical protein HBA54_20350 [Pelagibius litoralis]|uniref:Uncharacterized protein n=1 Tax=Pelagibius litoralis TaxID=374515 RepID=A0A967F0X6_9PROT|nr:hypothetical protein [Pelagibius litoralis]NIA70956.1 hypothetical protein [Pelagibius litoralis]